MVGSLGWKSFMQNGIESIAFKCGDEYGVLQRSRKFGGTGGTGSTWKTDKVRTYLHIYIYIYMYCYYSVTLIMHFFFCETRN